MGGGGSKTKSPTVEALAEHDNAPRTKSTRDVKDDDLMSMKSSMTAITHITSKSGASGEKLSKSSLFYGASASRGRMSFNAKGNTEETMTARAKLIAMPKGHLRRLYVENSILSGQISFVKNFGAPGSNDENCRQDQDLFDEYYIEIPPLLTVPVIQRNLVMAQKLHMCSLVYDWSDPEVHKEEKKVQMDTAKELLKYVNEPPMGAEDFYTDVIFANLINVLEMHTLRRVVNTNNGGVEKSGQMKTTTDPDKEPQTDRNDPSFLFTKNIYEILIKFIGAMKGGDAKNFIDGSFCLAVLAKLDTADDRERHMLKALCLKVYIKFTEHRKLLRHCMNHEFNRFSYETGKHQGVVELLEILEPIVKGFKAPRSRTT